MALYCSCQKVLCCSLPIQKAFQILEGQQNIQHFQKDVLFSQSFPSAPSHFSKRLCCAVCLFSLVMSFLHCLLWSLMGRAGLFLPSLLHREKKDGVPNGTGRDEAGQRRLLMLKYYLNYIEFDGTEWRNGIFFIPFPHLFGRSSSVKSHSAPFSWQFVRCQCYLAYMLSALSISWAAEGGGRSCIHCAATLTVDHPHWLRNRLDGSLLLFLRTAYFILPAGDRRLKLSQLLLELFWWSCFDHLLLLHLCSWVCRWEALHCVVWGM